MKKLLVLTDFTANAFHAAGAALHLARKMDTGILLYHTLPYIPLIPSDSGGPYVTETATMLFEDSKERLIREADKLREVAAMRGYAAEITERSGDGSLGDLITELTEDPDVELVVMGGRSGGALDHLLSGSDTAAVIRKAKKPVLVIPLAASGDIPKKMLFASDFGDFDIPAVSYLHQLAARLGTQLDIVHMVPHGEVVTEIGAEVAFRKYLDQHHLNFNQVFAEDVHQGLQHYCKQNGVDMLAMTHGEHSFIARLFGHSETRA
ncbi:universal stress protein, partial [Mucilaginibacter aquariorum]